MRGPWVVGINVDIGERGRLLLGVKSEERMTLIEHIGTLKKVWGIVVIFPVVMGGIYTGMVTPTEASALGAFGALVIWVSLKKLNFRKCCESLFNACAITFQIFIIILRSLLFAQFLSVSGAGGTIVNSISNIGIDKYVIFSGFMVMYEWSHNGFDIAFAVSAQCRHCEPGFIGLGNLSARTARLLHAVRNDILVNAISRRLIYLHGVPNGGAVNGGDNTAYCVPHHNIS